MSKLYFRYGAMCSAKTMNLLAVAHNYRTQGKKILLVKPKLDDRFEPNLIKSRSGISNNCDLLVNDENDLMSLYWSEKIYDCILVDECQFLSEKVIEFFRLISTSYNIPVICYGLRTDFQTKLFPGSKRLLELADSIEEIKTTCLHCNKKALFNMRINDGKPVTKGKQIETGLDDKYEPVCPDCWSMRIKTFNL